MRYIFNPDQLGSIRTGLDRIIEPAVGGHDGLLELERQGEVGAIIDRPLGFGRQAECFCEQGLEAMPANRGGWESFHGLVSRGGLQSPTYGIFPESARDFEQKQLGSVELEIRSPEGCGGLSVRFRDKPLYDDACIHDAGFQRSRSSRINSELSGKERPASVLRTRSTVLQNASPSDRRAKRRSLPASSSRDIPSCWARWRRRLSVWSSICNISP